MKRKFKHRKVTSYSYRYFNRVFDSLVKSFAKAGLSIECSGLIDCKPMLSESEKETFLKTLDKAKEEIYKQRTEEYYTQVILENFCYKINDSIKDVDLLKVEKI